MKKSLVAIVSMACLALGTMLLAGCPATATINQGSAAAPVLMSPAAAARIVCLPVQTAIGQGKVILSNSPPSDATAIKISAAMKIASPVIDAMCTAGAQVTATNIQDFATQAIPALASIVPVLPITPTQQAQAQAILMSAAVVVGMVEGIQANIAAQAKAAAAGATPATPAPASTPLSSAAPFVLSAK